MRLIEMQQVPDLTLKLDPRGRLWVFRPTEPTRTIAADADLTATGVAVNVDVPGIDDGDMRADIHHGILSLRAADEVVCEVLLPRNVDAAGMEIVREAGGIQINVPWSGVQTNAA
jgi:hypothetical protein